MVRTAVRLAAVATALAAPVSAHAQLEQRTLLMPGVTYSRQVQFTPHGPVVVHVVTAPRPGGLYALRPVLSNDLIQGRERVTAMERRVSVEATVVGTNGDDFVVRDGHPVGGLVRGGVMDTSTDPARSTLVRDYP